ncbi:MAG: hypothetical protein WBA74_10490, partial [Cyclobacteriaceae bacterium]
MIKQARGTIKNFQLFFFFSFCALSHSVLADPGDRLTTADSLFQAKKYTESFELYEQIIVEDMAYSPAMLLKMAFIKEGLGDYSNALY